MMGLFVRNCLLPALGMSAVIMLVIGFVAWLAYVINSIARSADALERIADALENDEDAEGEDTKKEGGVK